MTPDAAPRRPSRHGRRAAAPALAVLALATVGCGGATSSPGAAAVGLRDATDASGIDFVHDSGPVGTYFMPEVMGSGAALFDHDGDGDLDAYLVNGSMAPGVAPAGEWPRNRMFRQEPDGRFTDVTDASGLGDTGWGMGVAVGDVDNDGDLDVYVTNHGPNALFRNRGDGTFENVTDEAGVGHPGWGSSAAFFDHDADGWLDLYVANYLQLDPPVPCTDAAGRPEYCGPDSYYGARHVLYHNEGDGTFRDVSEESGVGLLGRAGLGVVVADLTEDGRLDVFVANDMHPNFLWVNRGDGTFEDEAVLRGVAFNAAGNVAGDMGIVCDDLDGDGRFDLFVTHLEGEGVSAYRNVGSGMLVDDAPRMGLLSPSVPYTGFGAVALDLEHDGDLDIAAVNGRVFRGHPDPDADVGEFWNPYAQKGQLLINDGGGRFVEDLVSAPDLTAIPRVGRGLAAGDVDGDGDVDLLASYGHDRARLFLNEATKRGSWLLVRAHDERLGRDALGARLTVRAGERRFVRSAHPAGSYLSSGDPRAHFGLGAARAYDAIDVVWPDGTRETFPGGEAGREVTLVRGGGKPAP
jgi:hypothetical protein